MQKSLLKRLIRYLGPYRWEFTAALCCMVIFGASDGVIPFLVKHILDGVFTHQNQSMLYLLPVVLIVFACVRAGCDFGQQFLMSRIGHKIVRDVRNQLNSHFLALGPDYFVRNPSGNLVARLTSDVILIKSLLTESAASLIRDFIRIMALLVAAFYLDPLLALIAFVVFPVAIIPVHRFGRKVRRLSKHGQDAIGELSSMLHESIAGNRVVHIFGRQRFEEERFKKRNESLTHTFIRSERARALTGPVNEILASFAIAAIILYGGFSVIGGLRSQGEFLAFLVSVFLLYDPFKKLSRLHTSIQQGLAGAERIFEILESEPQVSEVNPVIELGVKNNIAFENVWFNYPGNAERPALSGINLQIAPGEKVAFVGFSGAGKSTLMDLLVRFIDPSSGTVRIGDTDISKVSLKELRARIALVGQHTFLFNDTVINNIAYGKEGATFNELEQAARAAFALEFIKLLPHGINTVLGEGGFALSGGERQRIAIARAILKDAPILILDEATASLDNKSEREVQLALERLQKDRTTLIVAHRLSTVRNVDRIVVLKEGRIVEIGTYDQLLSDAGEFAKLHALQFKQAGGDDEAIACTA